MCIFIFLKGMYNHCVNFNKVIFLELLSFSPWIDNRKQIMNVSIFVQWQESFHSVKD